MVSLATIDPNARALPSHSTRLSLNENESSLLVVTLTPARAPRPAYAHTVAFGLDVPAEDIGGHYGNSALAHPRATERHGIGA